MVAEHLADMLAKLPRTAALIDARGLADQLGVARDWVYANAEQLGAVRLGTGPRARLRFDAERARAVLSAPSADDLSAPTSSSARRRGRPRRRAVTGVPLIQGRSSE